VEPIDLLLVIAAAALVVAGFLIHPALGCLAITVSAVGLRWLLAEVPEQPSVDS
jgi:hypothetical protein